MAETFTISKAEYDTLSVHAMKYGILLEAVADCLELNYDGKKLRAYDNDRVDVGLVVRAIEPTIYNSLLAKKKKEKAEKEKGESDTN
jgi:hypothetical protein